MKRFRFPLLFLIAIFALIAQFKILSIVGTPTHRLVASIDQHSCPELFQQIIFKTSDDELILRKIAFEKMLKKRPQWQRQLLDKLWRQDVEEGRFAVVSRRSLLLRKSIGINPIEKNIKTFSFRPYILDLPIEVKNAFVQIGKKNGLKDASEYVIIPAKLMLSNAAVDPIRTVIFIAGITGAGEILSVAGITVSDPLLSQSSTLGMGDNEILLLINNDTGKKLGESYASIFGTQEVNNIAKNDPKHVRVLNMYEREDKLIEFVKGLKGKTIKKIIVTGHGNDGVVYVEDYNHEWGNGTALSVFGSYLSENLHLSEYLGNNVEIYFAQCLLAATEFGRTEVQAFADRVIPQKGKVVVNRYVGIAGIDQNHLTFKSTSDSISDAAFLLTPILYDLFYFQFLDYMLEFSEEQGSDKDRSNGWLYTYEKK